MRQATLGERSWSHDLSVLDSAQKDFISRGTRKIQNILTTWGKAINMFTYIEVFLNIHKMFSRASWVLSMGRGAKSDLILPSPFSKSGTACLSSAVSHQCKPG